MTLKFKKTMEFKMYIKIYFFLQETISEDQAKEYIAAYEPQKNMQLEDQMSLIGNTKWY